MPNQYFQPKQFTVDDRRTAISDTLIDGEGNAIDLTGHTVAFRMVAKSDNSVKVNNQSATVDDATTGKVSYSWASGDLDTAGEYWYYWIVTRTSDSKTETFPGDGPRSTVRVNARK